MNIVERERGFEKEKNEIPKTSENHGSPSPCVSQAAIECMAHFLHLRPGEGQLCHLHLQRLDLGGLGAVAAPFSISSSNSRNSCSSSRGISNHKYQQHHRRNLEETEEFQRKIKIQRTAREILKVIWHSSQSKAWVLLILLSVVAGSLPLHLASFQHTPWGVSEHRWDLQGKNPGPPVADASESPLKPEAQNP